jgi:NitT/TauT family transport system ATP-binding protein
MFALQLDRVSRDFTATRGTVYRALDDISLTIEQGAFVAIVGPSGCGKSTLLNLAAGLLAPTAGEVRVDGSRLAGLNRHATYMFQQDALLPWKTVRDNVALGPALAGTRLRDARAHADAWLERVGLAGFAGHYPAQLSGGMRKRVAIAQNWILGRSQVLMDEPFSALDVHTRQLMESELLQLWDGSTDQDTSLQPGSGSHGRRRTVVFVTHDLHEAISLADEVVVLSAGPASRIVARHRVTLARPRQLLDVQASPEFGELYRALWSILREQVVLSQRRTEQRV